MSNGTDFKPNMLDLIPTQRIVYVCHQIVFHKPEVMKPGGIGNMNQKYIGLEGSRPSIGGNALPNGPFPQIPNPDKGLIGDGSVLEEHLAQHIADTCKCFVDRSLFHLWRIPHHNKLCLYRI